MVVLLGQLSENGRWLCWGVNTVYTRTKPQKLSFLNIDAGQSEEYP
jgi:hypothetical protein